MSESVQTQDPETLEKVKSLLDERINQTASTTQTVAEATPEQQPRMESEKNTTYDPSINTQSGTFAWNLNIDSVGDIEVTDLEKSMYLKAVLNDVPVILPISLEMGSGTTKVTVDIRTLSNYEMDLVFWCLDQDRKEGIIGNPATLATRIQYYAGGMQAIKVNSSQLSYISFPEPGNMEEDGGKLRNHVRNMVAKINWPRWQIILTALRVFEAKVKICNDAALNGNFWKPQGAE
jgi:hypothetical protein